MARRGNGEGTICQRKDGRWCAAAYVLLPNGGEKRMFVYGRTRDDVYAKLVELQDKRRRNVPVIPRSLKLGDYMEYWLAQVVRPVARWNTYKKYEQTVRLYLKPGLGQKPLGRVRVADVQDFLNKQIHAGHSIAKSPDHADCIGCSIHPGHSGGTRRDEPRPAGHFADSAHVA